MPDDNSWVGRIPPEGQSFIPLVAPTVRSWPRAVATWPDQAHTAIWLPRCRPMAWWNRWSLLTSLRVPIGASIAPEGPGYVTFLVTHIAPGRANQSATFPASQGEAYRISDRRPQAGLQPR